MKKIQFIVCIFFICTNTDAQTLFTYGNHSVSKPEFLKAFEKSPATTNNRQKELSDYLRLYINYKLKLKAAYDEHLNEQTSVQLENNNFKKQIAESVINEEADIKALTKEAFKRSKKDILVAQVFIEFGKDTSDAYKQIQQAYAQLRSGKSFEIVALNFSTDTDVKKTKGTIGYITVFTLPYEIENIIYQLKPGTISSIYKSKYGYHIFKNISERIATGKRKVEQILLSFPPNASENEKKKMAALADTIYEKIKQGNLFEQLAAQYNTDANTNTDGLLPDIGIGQYNTDFEEKVFGLQHMGEITKPFETSYGYHILKLISIITAEKNFNDAVAAILKQKIENSDRINIAKKQLLTKWMQLIQYKKANYNEASLWQYTKASINQQKNNTTTINDSSFLFSLAKKSITASDWINYLKGKVLENHSSDYYSNIFSAFVQTTCIDYYKEHLDEYSETMRNQLKEFGDANILFAAMDKHVWSKANDDSVALKEFYSSHIAKYQWQQGFSAIVVNAKTKETAVQIAGRLQQNINDWRNIISSYGNNVFADSSRFEDNLLPVQQKVEHRIGFISTPERSNDNNYIFLIITQLHNNKEQKTFEESKGMVINDYQQLLEEKWIAELKKKYPVTINHAVWKTVK